MEKTMIKIEHTRTHDLNPNINLQMMKEGKIITPNQVLVTDAESVLVNAFNYAMREYYGTDKVPILISRTEKILNNDWYYDVFHGTIHQYTGVQVIAEKYHFKILALPEHFSQEQLQQYVDGKLKEGKCLVECEDLCDYEGEELYEITPQIVIKSPLTIYPVERTVIGNDGFMFDANSTYPAVKEKGLYTREEIDALIEFVRQPFEYNVRQTILKKKNEWFEQYIK